MEEHELSLVPREDQEFAKQLFASVILRYNRDFVMEKVYDNPENGDTYYGFNGMIDIPFESPDESENPLHFHKFSIGIWASYVVPHKSRRDESRETSVLWSLFVGEKCEYFLYCGGFSYLLNNVPFPQSHEIVEDVKKNVKEVFSLPF